MYNKEYMGATKRLYQELQEKRQESHEITDRIIGIYGEAESLSIMQWLEDKLLDNKIIWKK